MPRISAAVAIPKEAGGTELVKIQTTSRGPPAPKRAKESGYAATTHPAATRTPTSETRYAVLSASLVYSLKKPCVIAFWLPWRITAGQRLCDRSVSHAITTEAAVIVIVTENTGSVNHTATLSKSVTSAAKRISGQCHTAQITPLISVTLRKLVILASGRTQPLGSACITAHLIDRVDRERSRQGVPDLGKPWSGASQPPVLVSVATQA